MQTVKRIVPLEEVAAKPIWEDMADLARIFHHQIIEDNAGTWRWKQNELIASFIEEITFHTPPEWRGPSYNQLHQGSVDLNTLAVQSRTGKFSLEEWMKFNMQIGYSLNGYAEVFGQHEVTEFGLEYLTPPPEDHDFDHEYYQTPIEYMRIKHKGKVLHV